MNPFDPGYFTENELTAAGFKSMGRNVRIARNCTIVGTENIELGHNVRIDGYVSLIAAGPGSLRIGSCIHIGSYSFLSAAEGIVIENFCNLSQAVRIYSRSDDYSGIHMTNPTIPRRFTGVTRGPVHLGKHVIIGSGSVVMPAVDIQEGSAIGALSFVKESLGPWAIYAGCPARRIKARSRRLLELEAELAREPGFQI